MGEINATILIPDISGFTEFMTSTELSHGTRAINMLMEAIVKAVGEAYEVSEIEGDAVLLIKNDPAPSKKEILETCLKIFNTFHFQRKWMEQHRVCPCRACESLINLTLKFVVHHGALAEIKVGRFEKHSGLEMIVAHRLLKNSIDNNEYLLMTEKMFQQVADAAEVDGMEWTISSEEYASIGKVGYRFALLNKARKNVPEPPALQNYYRTDNTPYLQTPIAADFREVYMVMMNIPGRYEWMPGLKKVEQDFPDVFVGSLHCCTFENYQAIISPLRMDLSEKVIIYAESCRIEEMGLFLVHEFVFEKTAERTCIFSARFMNDSGSTVSEETNTAFLERFQQMAESLKVHCEKMEKTNY